MKKINIPLPSIEGVELKNATIDLEKGIVVAEYGRKGEFDKVPNNIEIYRFQEMCSSNYEKGDGLHIAFNNNKQLLSISDGMYNVQPNDKLFFEKVECCLKPIAKDDIKPGDTIYARPTQYTEFDSLSNYIKVLPDNKCVCVDHPTELNNTNSIMYDSILEFDEDIIYFKVTPIK